MIAVTKKYLISCFERDFDRVFSTTVCHMYWLSTLYSISDQWPFAVNLLKSYSCLSRRVIRGWIVLRLGFFLFQANGTSDFWCRNHCMSDNCFFLTWMLVFLGDGEGAIHAFHWLVTASIAKSQGQGENNRLIVWNRQSVIPFLQLFLFYHVPN